MAGTIRLRGKGRSIGCACALVALFVVGPVVAAPSEERLRSDRLDDFDAFCTFVADEYAYFDRKRTDWPAVCATYRPMAAEAGTRSDFIAVIERALAELYDPHAHLGTSTARSPRLVPTDSDLDAEWRGDRAVIVDVRAASAAFAAGARPGMTVIAIDDRPVDDVVADILPKHLTTADPAAHDWALRVALAGRQNPEPVRIDVADDGTRRRFAYRPALARPAELLTVRRLGQVGVVTINNALGDSALVAAFDEALDALGDATALVLDLRDTPSGGNTTAARGLMGRLVIREAAYQRHERVADQRATGVRRVWVEYVEPRGRAFTGAVVVLVGRWTGSMGEGIAIGLDAARRAPVLGPRMAGLLGGLGSLTLPRAGITVRVPAERLLHIDGTPREDFVPCPLAAHAPGDADAEVDEAARLAAALANERSPSVGGCPRPP